jgi:hypothetical protein
MLSDVMLNVVMLSVMAPLYACVVQPHVDVIKLFSPSLTVGQNKLQCLSLHVLLAGLQ